MGGVILAAIANKRFDSLDKAVHSLVSYKTSFFPSKQLHQAYTSKYNRFLSLFSSRQNP